MIVQRAFFPASYNPRIAATFFTTLAAVSLVLCGAATGLWIASYFVRGATPQGFRLLRVRLGEGDDCLFLRPGIVEHAILGSVDHEWLTDDVLRLWAPALVFLLAAVGCIALRRFLPRNL